MKIRAFQRSLKTWKIISLIFVVFFLVLFLTSPPAKMKRLALTQDWSTGVDSFSDLALTADTGPKIGAPLPASPITESKGSFTVSQVIGSGNLYRGPPSFSL